jgi:hypothetical protein
VIARYHLQIQRGVDRVLRQLILEWVSSCRGLDRRKGSLETIRLGYSPTSANPRVMDSIGGFKAWAVGSSGLLISFNPIVFFVYSVVVEDG